MLCGSLREHLFRLCEETCYLIWMKEKSPTQPDRVKSALFHPASDGVGTHTQGLRNRE